MSVAVMDREVKDAIARIKVLPGVTRAMPGSFVTKKHDHPIGSVKFIEPAPHGARLRVFTTRGMANVHVYTKDPNGLALRINGGVVDDKPQPAAAAATVAAELKADTTAAPAVVKKPADIGSPFQTVRIGKQTKKGQPVYPAEPAPMMPAAPVLDTAIRGQLVKVTPEIAVNWLERNSNNRDLKNSRVQLYAADMKNGKWLPGGATIKFDTNGNILNGQHCLWAVIESGVTIEVFVMSGVDPEVFKVEDNHIGRTILDAMKISTHGTSGITANMAGAATVMRESMEWAQGRISRPIITRQDQFEFIGKHSDALKFAYGSVGVSRGTRKGIMIAPVLAVLARAYYTIDQERLKRFGRVLATGIVEDTKENTAVVLRNWLMTQVGMTSATGETRRDTYRRVERCLRAFLDGEVLRVLKPQPTIEEMFPLPEEPKRRKRKET